MATDKSKSRSKPEAEAPEATPESKSEAKKPRAKMLFFNRRGGFYQCTYHFHRTKDGTPNGEKIMDGTGVQSMGSIKFRLAPGVNLVDPDIYDLVKDNPGFKARLAKREIVESRKAWSEMAEAECIEEVMKAAHLPTLADLAEVETREAVAEAIEVSLEVATRAARKKKKNKHLTPTQIARSAAR